MIINDCFPVIAITSFCGDSQIFFYEAVMFCPVKPPPKAVNEGVVLVTNEELDGVEHGIFSFRLLTTILYSDLRKSQEIILDVKHLIN